MLVCQIDIGSGESVQICTGAWNVHVGDLVPAALHNSLLPGGVKITKGKLWGVESNGMLCSLKELNVTTHDYPYAVIEAAAILGDYHPIDPAELSISPDIKAGEEIHGQGHRRPGGKAGDCGLFPVQAEPGHRQGAAWRPLPAARTSIRGTCWPTIPART
ncbi:MAG: hypothetical protein V8T45_07780 [Oscillospiraceae bacterium]